MEESKRRSQGTLLNFLKRTAPESQNKATPESNDPEPISGTCSFQPEQEHLDPASDITFYVNKHLDNSTKERILRSPFVPPKSFEFPIEVKRRLKFQHNWLERFPWLSYSQKEDGAFCRYCVIFGKTEGGKGTHQKLGALVSKAYNRWKDAIEVFTAHAQTNYHKTAVLSADNFLRVMDGKETSVLEQIDTERQRKANENRARLLPIVETIILCGRQELALRGSGESGSVLNADPEINDGNFRALLRFRAFGGDAILKKHLESSSLNAMYTSPKIQNSLIEICGEIIQEEIVKKVNNAQCFSVLADETTDISRVEQMSLCVRYVDGIGPDAVIREDFLQFVPVHDLTGRGLAFSIIETLNKLGINLQYMVGQGYDGASAMSGHLNGVRAEISKLYPKALYVHCAAHSLNLALSKSCSVPQIRNSLGTLKEVVKFFNASAKRSHILKEKIQDHVPSSRQSKLISMCDTRWVERHESIQRFKELYNPMVSALQELESSCNGETSRNAHQFLSVVTSGAFVISLLVADKIFTYTLPLCKALQKVDCDLAESCAFIKDVASVFEEMRTNADTEFQVLFEKSEEMMSSIGGEITMPRITSHQTTRSNVPASNLVEYYKRSIFIPFVDFICSELEQRFTKHSELISSLQIALPKMHLSVNSNELEKCAEFYQDMFPDADFDTISSEFSLWKRKWSTVDHQKLPSSALDSFVECNSQFFPNIKILLRILATLPVSTATVERSFSTMKRVKSFLRNATSDSRLTGLALLTVHRGVSIKPNEVIDRFAKCPRRSKLII